jgi:hypothetical protein
MAQERSMRTFRISDDENGRHAFNGDVALRDATFVQAK